LEEIAALAKKHDFWIYADEVYSQIIYDGKFESIASVEGMYERTILSDGASKSYAMPGWRLGFAANPSLAPHLARWVTNTESCANHMTQHAIIRALDGPHDDTHAMVAEFKRRRDVMVRLLNEMDGVSCQMPAGAFYAYPNVNGALSKLGFRSAEQLRQMLLKEGVAVLADHHFGRREPGEKNHYIRLSYCTSMENIEKGLARMKGVLGAK
jgi:aspartate/methionine/tyrosine aminotransferase